MALEAQSLVKEYGQRRVVDGMTLRVNPGKIIGLLGPNGAGKTTTFLMMMGFIAADEGRVLLHGKDISRFPFYKRARLGIGYLPQEPSVFTRASVEENLDLVLEREGQVARQQELREEIMRDFALGQLRKRRAGSLSAGERRRLEIARCLATDPAFILLDEPFSGIDPISISDLQEHVTGLRERGIGLIITDHNVRDTLSITDYAYLMNEGQMITEGTPEEIVRDPLARRFYLGERFRA
ncbi:MAG TPA: LPS export ABC transporter ATP-binding protein [Candidatus Acetothermia bacterium]|nr:LPS export ABC transporter ATP-binding protein [Candidatus Acetothermia bacterium]